MQPNTTPAGILLPPGVRAPSNLEMQVTRLQRMQAIVDDPKRLKALLDRLPRAARRAYSREVKHGKSKVQAMLAAVARAQA